MGRAPCCDKSNVKKGPWSPEEDAKLKEFIEKFGTGGNWIALPQKVGLRRCGKSCRLRWLNYLRPDIKHGEFSDEEDRIICTLYASIGSRWSIIAAQLPGRTDNDIKNYWNTKLKKKLMIAGINRNNNKISPPQPPFSSLLTQPPPHQPAVPPITLSQLYNSFYTQASKSLMINNNNIDYQPMFSTPQNDLNNSNFSLFASPQYTPSQNLQEGFVDLQYNNYQPLVKLADSNMLVFGNNEAAATSCCSNSSDGSCSQISYGVKQEEMRGSSSSSNFQGFTATALNPTNDHHDNKFVLQNYGDHHQQQQQQFVSGHNLDHDRYHKQPNGVLENSKLQYELEQVKQLIVNGDMSENVININNLSFNDNDDEYKTTNERMVYQFQHYY